MGLFKTEEQRAQEKAQQWWWTPPGLARQAFDRGDAVFQAAIELGAQDAYVETMVGVGTHDRSTDPNALLNEICGQGWDLVSGSVVFVFTGQQSRDKFMASGQQVAVSGRLVGYYLFRRRS